MKVINPWQHELPGVGEVSRSHAVVCGPKQMMFVAGGVSENQETKETVGKGDLVGQLRQIHENIKRVVKEGSFTMKELVKRRLFVSEEGAEKMGGPESAMEILEMGKEYFSEPNRLTGFVWRNRLLIRIICWS